jgi:hypothetical protein
MPSPARLNYTYIVCSAELTGAGKSYTSQDTFMGSVLAQKFMKKPQAGQQTRIRSGLRDVLTFFLLRVYKNLGYLT